MVSKFSVYQFRCFDELVWYECAILDKFKLFGFIIKILLSFSKQLYFSIKVMKVEKYFYLYHSEFRFIYMIFFK